MFPVVGEIGGRNFEGARALDKGTTTKDILAAPAGTNGGSATVTTPQSSTPQ